jgi:beta-aspartyl-peptidase (threonine type)
MTSSRKIITAILAITMIFVSAIARQKKPAPTASQVRAVLDAQVEAWNRRDLEGFMKGYWNSPELTFYSGATKTSGWEATIERYRKRYQGEGREMGFLTFDQLQIEVLGPQSAFVRGRWHLKLSEGEAGGLFTLVFRKFPDGWKIIHDHTGSS